MIQDNDPNKDEAFVFLEHCCLALEDLLMDVES
jgi:hypothetical protein